MNPKEIVKKTIAFDKPERIAYSFPEKYGNDFKGISMSPTPDARPNEKGINVDEWGAIWENIGICQLGEVKEYPLKDWNDFDKLNIPDIKDPKRWENLENDAKNPENKYLLAYGISIYERIHFIRGLENTWTDIYENPDELKMLIDILVDMNIYSIEKYKTINADGFMFCDDWGLQNRLMISPEKWREFWKPAYTKIYRAAHKANMQTFLHSCGYIVDILDDLIEAGLDVIQMDQQLNMGLENLKQTFNGRITFWCPVDIQAVMCKDDMNEIKLYCHKLKEQLGNSSGGFMPKWYGDPIGAGHSEEAVDIMCKEFLKIKY